MFAFLFNIQIILAFFPELRTLQQICCRRKRSTSGGCCSGAVLGHPGVPTVSRRQISPFRVWKTTRRKWTSNIETRNSKQKIFLKKTPMYMRIYIFILDCFFLLKITISWRGTWFCVEFWHQASHPWWKGQLGEAQFRVCWNCTQWTSMAILFILQFLGPWTWLVFFLDFWWTFRFRFLSELFCKCSGQCFSGSWRRWPEPEHGGR